MQVMSHDFNVSVRISPGVKFCDAASHNQTKTLAGGGKKKKDKMAENEIPTSFYQTCKDSMRFQPIKKLGQ